MDTHNVIVNVRRKPQLTHVGDEHSAQKHLPPQDIVVSDDVLTRGIDRHYWQRFHTSHPAYLHSEFEPSTRAINERPLQAHDYFANKFTQPIGGEGAANVIVGHPYLPTPIGKQTKWQPFLGVAAKPHKNAVISQAALIASDAADLLYA